MVGAIPGEIAMHPKPVGRGYVILEAQPNHPWRSTDKALGSAPLHAHEFHYSSLSGLPAGTRYAYAMRRGHGIDGQHDGILLHHMLASYTHLRATTGCDWPAKFVHYVRSCQNIDSKEATPCSH